jgi:nucleoside 2-deoxyribosyltransferase
MRIYLASPYGFTDSGRFFMNKSLIPFLTESKLEVLNPWDHFKIEGESVIAQDQIQQNRSIAIHNEKLLRDSDMVLAILDGPDVDSGVASEIGLAYALKKRIIGYRSDLRLSGENLGAVVNLQLEYFIHGSGGKIIRNLEELKQELYVMDLN